MPEGAGRGAEELRIIQWSQHPALFLASVLWLALVEGRLARCERSSKRTKVSE